ncbi:conserved exported hypothetical protein [Hyphomicrobiales bacterium]|nr:conserved exported hypothetical protein [Hyphomicrobiales bacterium]CAH1701162.1 conserved exported hypothetical protein [Hyphomicrobiales bacterium]CAI0345127.1 conserved exported hypothetical protein [Hyphomicrobiales bacterium]
MRSVLIVSAFLIGLAGGAQAQTAAPAQPATAVVATAAAGDQPIPQAERAKARQDCLSENVALSGEDLRAAMRLCMQAKFPGVRLYAQDGVTRDGKPTAVAARAACKEEVDSQNLQGSERVAALTACFNAKRPDLAQRSECRKEARGKGLDGAELRKAVDACAREARG